MSRELFNHLFLTEHRKGGKMQNKDSIMLSHPTFCERKCGICGQCYSKRMSKYKPILAGRQEQNSKVLSDPAFRPCKLNTIDSSIRWGSTGEMDNQVQYRNICRMAEENRHLVHALWTKRVGLINGPKPYNLNLVWSATKVDVSRPFIPAGFDIGFFCYSSKDEIPEGVDHICQRKCSQCNYCYQHHHTAKVVAEIVGYK
ncbi:MAG: hypothetical protein LLG05_10495 [Porphyromonadaceae bacterium]|nr:hypothetical protein [Porphyromonadaceae bacterium]